MTDITDYETDIRSITPEYTHTTARQAGHEVEDGATVHLDGLTVTVMLKWRSSAESYRRRYEITFTVDHDEDLLRFASYDLPNHDHADGVGKLIRALERADEAAWRWTNQHTDGYSVVSLSHLVDEASEAGPDVTIFDELEVRD